MHAGREPHDAPAEDSFPTAAQWVGIAQQLREDERSLLLPAPLPPRPRFAGRSRSSRIRQPRRRALGVWRSAAKVVAILNSMDTGRAGSTTKLLAASAEAPDGEFLRITTHPTGTGRVSRRKPYASACLSTVTFLHF